MSVTRPSAQGGNGAGQLSVGARLRGNSLQIRMHINSRVLKLTEQENAGAALHYRRRCKDGEVRTAAACNIRLGLKIDEVTFKTATAPRAKVSAASLSATGRSGKDEKQSGRRPNVQKLKCEHVQMSQSLKNKVHLHTCCFHRICISVLQHR